MWRQGLRKFFRLGWEEQARLLEAGLWLTVAQLGVWLIPFRRMAPWLGARVPAPSAPPLDPNQTSQAERLGWAVRCAAVLTPWDSKCLAQALAAKAMLNRHHLPGALILGVAKPPQDSTKLEAHAWVRCGSLLLTGGPGHERFTVLAIFE